MNFQTFPIYFVIWTASVVLSRNHLSAQTGLEVLSKKILFDNVKSNVLYEIRQEKNEVYFRINDLEVQRIIFDKNSKINLVHSSQKKYFALIEYKFGKRSETTRVNVSTFDESFRTKDEFTFDYFYEEPIPIHKITDKGELILLYRNTGVIKKINGDGAIEKVLEKGIIENQERIGHLILDKNKIIVGLSNIEANDESFSKLFFLDYELNVLNSHQFDFNQLYSLHLLNNGNILVSAYNTSNLQPKLFLLDEIESIFIGNLFADNVVVNEDVFISDRKRIFKLNDFGVKQLFEFNNGDEIINIYNSEDNFFVITKNSEGFVFNVYTEDFVLKDRVSRNHNNISGWYFSKSRNKLFIFEKNQ